MNHSLDRLHGVFKCSVVAFAHMFHPRESARRDIYQWSRTLSVTGGTRALGTRTGKPVKISQQSVEGVKATACSLLTGSTQGSGGVRRQEGVRKARGTLWEICHCCSLILHSFSFLLFSSEMVWMPPKSAGDREEMSTTQCIDFNQSGELRENRRGERTLGLKHYVIRHRVWRILREKNLTKALRKGTGCFSRENCAESERVGMCVCWRARFCLPCPLHLFVCATKRSDSLHTDTSRSWHHVK